MSNDLTMFNDANAFNHGMMVAKVFSNSQLVPAHLRGKIEDCFIALNMAQVMGEHPLIVMQNIYMVSGKAGWSASYMVARANKSGVFKSPINWRKTGQGDTLEVTAYATLQNGDEVTASASMAMAKAEGWTKNAKYQSMPEHMLRYRSATFLIRLFAPEVMLGIPMADENEDVAAAQMKDVTPVPKRQKLADKIAAHVADAEPYMAAPVAQSLRDADVTVDAETGEILDADEHRDTPSSDPEMYVLEYMGDRTEKFFRADDYKAAYLGMMKAAAPGVRATLEAMNADTVARAKTAIDGPSHDEQKRNGYQTEGV